MVSNGYLPVKGGLAAPRYFAVELLAEVTVDFDARYAIPGDVCKFIDADVSPFAFE